MRDVGHLVSLGNALSGAPAPLQPACFDCFSTETNNTFADLEANALCSRSSFYFFVLAESMAVSVHYVLAVFVFELGSDDRSIVINRHAHDQELLFPAAAC